MIINDQHKFAFIHIPKCGGTSLRDQLSKFDKTKNNLDKLVRYHPKLGLIDYGHLPLFILKDHFKSDFLKIKDYWSFAFLRDPYKRFPSSLAQRLKVYRRKQIQNISKKDLKNEIDLCINYLSKNSQQKLLLAAEYIHFQRQEDYIYIDKHKVVESVYNLDAMKVFQQDFSKYIVSEIEINNSRKNDQSIVQRNGMIFNLIQYIHPISKPILSLLSEKNKQRVSSLVYISRDKKFEHIFESDYVKQFVNEYYEKDIELFALNRRQL